MLSPRTPAHNSTRNSRLHSEDDSKKEKENWRQWRSIKEERVTPTNRNKSIMNMKTPSSSTGGITKMEKRMLERERSTWNEDIEEDVVYQRSLELDEKGDIDEESEFYEDEVETPPEIERRGHSSERSKWIPANLVQNCCFDKRGQLLAKVDCEKNMERALKSKKGIDFYDLLKFSNTPEVRSVAFCLYMLDKYGRRLPKGLVDVPNATNVIFDLEAAREVDTEQVLPGAKRVLLSALISPALCSNWVGRTAVNKAVVSILEQILIRDPSLLVFSAPDSERSTIYPSIGTQFFEAFARLLKAGFHILEPTMSLVTLSTNVRSTTRNFIEKRRADKKEEVARRLKEFNCKLNEDRHFRAEEDAVQDITSGFLDTNPRKTRRCVKRELEEDQEIRFGGNMLSDGDNEDFEDKFEELHQQVPPKKAKRNKKNPVNEVHQNDERLDLKRRTGLRNIKPKSKKYDN